MLRFSVLSFLKQVVLKTVSVSLLICLVNCTIYLLLPDMYGKRIIFLFFNVSLVHPSHLSDRIE